MTNMTKIQERQRFGFGSLGKLVRDKTMEQCCKEDPSSSFSYKYLTDQELQPHLFNKLQEEVIEVIETKSKEQMCSELADLLDVIDAIKKHNLISEEEIATVRKRKAESRGGFDARLFIEWIEFEPSEANRLYEYYLLNPQKYPKIDPK